MVQEELEKIIIASAKKSFGDFALADVSIERTKEAAHGDYSTNVALALSKQLKKNPLEIAQKIADGIKSPLFEKVAVASPGFINFYLSKEYFVDVLKSIDKNFGKNNSLKNEKVIVEYTDPNPFKEFHIGHLMSNSIGESIARIFEFQGAKMKRACYQGDVGMHVAKAIWGKRENPD